MARSTSSTSFIFISDLHVGSTKSVCSPEPTLGESQGSYRPNPFQHKLYRGWEKVFDMIEQPKRVRALFINGEIGDGPNLKKPGLQQWSLDPYDQLYDGNKLLKPYLDLAQDTFVVKGTDYHSSPSNTAINYDEIFARMSGATGYRTIEFKEDAEYLGNKVGFTKFGQADIIKRRKAIPGLSEQGFSDTDISRMFGVDSSQIALDRKFLKGKSNNDNGSIKKQFIKEDKMFKGDFESRKKFKVNGWDQLTDSYFLGKFYGKKITVTHHIPYSKTFSSRAGPLGKETMLFALEKDRWFEDGYESVLHARGHVHYCVNLSYPGEDSFTISCWKWPDAHLTRSGIGGITPTIGIVECIVESNGHVDCWKHVLRKNDYPKPSCYDLTPLVRKVA